MSESSATAPVAKFYPTLALAALLLFHFASNVWWLRVDNHAPTGDELTHLRLAFEYFQAFEEIATGKIDGAGAAIERVLQVDTRIYPPLQHILGGLACLIYGEYNHDVLTFIHTIEFLLLILLVYLTARIRMEPWPSFFVAFAASFFPGFYGISRLFTPEMEAILLVVAAVYALLKTNYFRSLPWVIVFGLIAGLGFLTRWTTAAYYFPAVVAYLVMAVYIRVRDAQPGDRRGVFASIITNAVVSVIITIGVFAPWYVDHFPGLIGGFEDYYAPRIADAPPVPFNNHERWTRYAAYIIHKGIFWPTFALSMVGLGIALAKSFRSGFHFFLAMWAIGGYLVLAVVVWEFKHPAPRYSLPMLAPLAFLAIMAIMAISPRKIRGAAYAAFAALLVVQFIGLSYFSFGRFGYIDIPVYNFRGYQFAGDDYRVEEGAVLYNDKVLLAGGAFFAAPYRGENWHERLFGAILDREKEGLYPPITATVASIRMRKVPLADLDHQFHPLAFPLSGSRLRSFDFVPELVPIVREHGRNNVTTTIVHAGNRIALPPLSVTARNKLVQLPVPSTLELAFENPAKIDAVVLEFESLRDEHLDYTLEYRTKDSLEFEPLPLELGDTSNSTAIYKVAGIECAALRLAVDAYTHPMVSLASFVPYTRVVQVRSLRDGPRLATLTDPDQLESAAYVLVDGNLSATETEILNRDFELIEQFDTLLQTHWWPATLSVYARRQAPAINFARDPNFRVRVTSDLHDADLRSRWDVPWWPFGIPPDPVDTRPPQFWRMDLPAVAEVDLGRHYDIDAIRIGVDELYDQTERIDIEYLDDATGRWLPALEGLAAIETFSGILEASQGTVCRKLRLVFSGPEELEFGEAQGYVTRVYIQGTAVDAPVPAAESAPQPTLHLAEQVREESALPAHENVHVLALGESLSDVAHRYGYSPQQLAILNGFAPDTELGAGERVSLKPGPTSPASIDWIHTVLASETLRDVARLYGLSPRDLARWNRLTPGATIVEGQQLFVEAPSPFFARQSARLAIVSSADSIEDIAEREDVTVQQLLFWNQWPTDTTKAPSFAVVASRPNRPMTPRADLHEIQTNDTWATVAAAHELSAQQLVAWNGETSFETGNVLFVTPPPKGLRSPPIGLHPLRSGETLDSIALYYDTSAAQLVLWNNISPDASLNEGDYLFVLPDIGDAFIECGENFIHNAATVTVQAGDTLQSIAAAHDLAPDLLATWNGLTGSNPLRMGQMLSVAAPAPQVRPEAHGIYVVQDGDNIAEVAEAFAVDEAELVHWNGLAGRIGIKNCEAIFVSDLAERYKNLVVAPASDAPAIWARANPPQYVLQPGDSQESVVQTTGLSIPTILAWSAPSLPKTTWRPGLRFSMTPPSNENGNPAAVRVEDNTSLFGLLLENEIALADFLVWNAIEGTPRLERGQWVFVAEPPLLPVIPDRTVADVTLLESPDELAEDDDPPLEKILHSNDCEVPDELVPDRRIAFIASPPLTPAPAASIHLVSDGETLAAIAAKYEVAESEILAWNRLSEQAPALLPGDLLYVSHPDSPSAPAEPGMHNVGWGETLYDIAHSTGIRVQELAGWNGISHNAIVIPGQRIRIRPPDGLVDTAEGIHRVSASDTMLSIARLNEVTLAQVAIWNRLTKDTTIRVGEHLYVKRPPAPPTAKQVEWYLMRWGETLFDAARRGGVTANQLRRWNGFTADTVIHEGQCIVIADAFADSPRLHELRMYDAPSGDSIVTIAVNHSVRVSDLHEWNPSLAERLNGSHLVGPERIIVSNPSAPPRRANPEKEVTIPIDAPAVSNHSMFGALDDSEFAAENPIIIRGDTIDTVAKRHDTNPERLIATNPHLLFGQYRPGDAFEADASDAADPLDGLRRAQALQRDRYARKLSLNPPPAERLQFTGKSGGAGVYFLKVNDAEFRLPLSTKVSGTYAVQSATGAQSLLRFESLDNSGAFQAFLTPPDTNGLLTLESTLHSNAPDAMLEIEGVPTLSFPALSENLAASPRGIYVAAIDPIAGEVVDTAYFDAYAPRQALRAADYIRALPEGALLAAAVSGDATFRGGPLAIALAGQYNVPIRWDEDWPEPYASEYFRAGMIVVAFNGMSGKAHFKHSRTKILSSTFRRGDPLEDSGLILPLDIYLRSAGSGLGKNASIRVAEHSIRYELVDADTVSHQLIDFGETATITTRWAEGERIDKIRISLDEVSTEFVEYSIKFFNENGREDLDGPAFEFAGPANAVRFYELEAPQSGTMLITANMDPEVRKTLSALSIQLFQRRGESTEGAEPDST